MKKTVDEILAEQPWKAGYPRESVCGVYYGDLPARILRETYTCGKYSALEAVDVYLAKRYAPALVESYLCWYGDGHMIRGGRLLCGDIAIRYGGGTHPYRLVLFDHAGLHGFCLSKWDADANVGVAYSTPGWPSSLVPVAHTRDDIDQERMDAVFRRVKTGDTYGRFAREMVRTARQMWAKLKP